MTDFEYRPGCPDDFLLLRSWVGSFTYKPGWTITVKTEGFTTHTLRFSFSYPRSDPPHDLVHIEVSYILDRGVLEMIQSGHLDAAKEAFVQTVVDAIRNIELHEAAEWLRFEGERLKDPHPYPPRGIVTL